MTAIPGESDVHVIVRFDEVPDTVLHYRSTRSAAEEFCRAARAQNLAQVSIDNDLSTALAPLPCPQLWGG